MKERDIERALARRVKELGGEIRKVAWVGRQGAPDRLVMLPVRSVAHRLGAHSTAHLRYWPRAFWVELKNPDTVKTFPANAHERAQRREHERMRKLGQRVEVIGTIEQIEELLA